MSEQKIPLQHIHEKLGAKMVSYAGFMMPIKYTSEIEEHLAVRQGVGVFDVSHMGEFNISGPEALNLIQRITSNDASKLKIGQAQYSCFPNANNGIVDDLLVYKLDEEDYMLVVNAANIEKDWQWIEKHNTSGASIKDVSADYCLLAVQGPRAEQVLQRLTEIDLSTIPYYHFVMGTCCHVDQVIISRTGYTGAGGFELYIPKANAESVWNTLFEAGKAEGIKPIGLGARDTLRLEMGFCLYGNDIDDHTSPLEAGLGWITKFTKEFVNSTNLQQQKQAGVTKKLVGFVMNERAIPRKGYTILDETGATIGNVTSGTMSPSLKIGLGLGYVKTSYAAEGTEIYIEVRNKPMKSTVQRLPFIKNS